MKGEIMVSKETIRLEVYRAILGIVLIAGISLFLIFQTTTAWYLDIPIAAVTVSVAIGLAFENKR